MQSCETSCPNCAVRARLKRTSVASGGCVEDLMAESQQLVLTRAGAQSAKALKMDHLQQIRSKSAACYKQDGNE